jgi:transcriptional regulator of met regulon
MATRKADHEDSKPRSATGMLKKDHKKVSALFSKWEESDDDKECAELMQQAILELKVHSAVEEELFYPEARKSLEDEGEIIDEAEEEHHVVKMLIEEIEDIGMDDERAHAKFKVLVENVRHHVKEEEGEMFPKIEDEDLNKELVDQMWERKQELMSEMGAEMGMPLPMEGDVSRAGGRA